MYPYKRQIQKGQSAEQAHFRVFCSEVALGGEKVPKMALVYYALSAWRESIMGKRVYLTAKHDLNSASRTEMVELASLVSRRLSRVVQRVTVEEPADPDRMHLHVVLRSDSSLEFMALEATSLLCGTDSLRRTALCLSYSASMCLDPSGSDFLPRRVQWTVSGQCAKDLVRLYHIWKKRRPLPTPGSPHPPPPKRTLSWDWNHLSIQVK